jgi:UDP-N-acetylglucosamine diphosphorylase/glucosamine-1-phosphate N-acetyltransferase
MQTIEPFITILLAGGLGKRMNSPLPKVLHLISNEPMIIRIIKEVSTLHPLKIFIVVGKYKSLIQETIDNYLPSITNIEYVFQENALGTGHAIQCCSPQLAKYSTAKTLILSGDVPLLTASTMSNILQKKSLATITTTHLENPTGYGRIVENPTIHIIEDKDCSPEQRQITKVNCGIYAFRCDILNKYIGQLTNHNSQKEYYLTDIIDIITKGEEETENMFVVVECEIPFENQKEILGVNTPEQLAQLQSVCLSCENSNDIYSCFNRLKKFERNRITRFAFTCLAFLHPSKPIGAFLICFALSAAFAAYCPI